MARKDPQSKPDDSRGSALQIRTSRGVLNVTRAQERVIVRDHGRELLRAKREGGEEAAAGLLSRLLGRNR